MTIKREDSTGLAGILDRLAAAPGAHSNGYPSRTGFPRLVQVLDRFAKINPHQHITGSVGDPALLRYAIQVYRQDSQVASRFLDYVEKSGFIDPQERKGFFRRTDSDLVRWFQRHIPLDQDPHGFEEADDRLNLARFAFQSNHQESAMLLKEAYRTVALENAAHGVEEVWFRTSLGDHEGPGMRQALDSAIEGARQAEEESGASINVRFVLGMRKFHAGGHSNLEETRELGSSFTKQRSADTKSMAMVEAVQSLCWEAPQLRRMIAGVDSVGADADWRPEWQACARSAAAGSKFHVVVHFGESWREGELLRLLGEIADLVKNGVIHHLDNANALFAANDTDSPIANYSESEWRDIARLQSDIFFSLAGRGIALGVNPASNDWLTRSLRHQDGWRFRRLDEPLDPDSPPVASRILGEGNQPNPLTVVVGNDNSRIYPSRLAGSYLTVSQELANLWGVAGSTPTSIYGKLPTQLIARLITNGFTLAEAAASSRRRPSQLEFDFDRPATYRLQPTANQEQVASRSLGPVDRVSGRPAGVA